MTSATGPKRRSEVRRGARGFTLLEMILVLGVALLISAAAVVSIGSLNPGSDGMTEAVSGYETVLRQARAHAMREVRRVRLAMDDSGRPMLTVESDPVGAPGQFDQPVEAWSQAPGAGRVRVVRVQRTIASDYASASQDEAGGMSDASHQALIFQPDGTSDSAEVELQPLDADAGGPGAVIRLDGFTGALATQWGEGLPGDGVAR